jgi:hypothetical protein
MTGDFALTANDKANPLWARIKAHLQDRLADARVRNDNPSLTMTEAQTAALRGHIACLKQIIALGDERLVIDE